MEKCFVEMKVGAMIDYPQRHISIYIDELERHMLFHIKSVCYSVSINYVSSWRQSSLTSWTRESKILSFHVSVTTDQRQKAQPTR
jgi:hypothetical protein